MGQAAEKFPLPGLPPEHDSNEVTSDMIVSEEALPANDEVAESLAELKEIHEERQFEEGKAEAARLMTEADTEIKAKIAEKDAESLAALKKKVETDKRKDSMKELRAKLAAPKGEKSAPGEIPAPPGYEEAQQAKMDKAMEDAPTSKTQMKLDEAKWLDIPNFDNENYEQAMYAVTNLEDEVKTSGFFKKLSLRRKLKKAKAQLKNYEGEIVEAKLDMQKDKRTAVQKAEYDAMSPEERAAYDKKKATDEKRAMHRLGMKNN